jgi:hypothetical protein
MSMNNLRLVVGTRVLPGEVVRGSGAVAEPAPRTFVSFGARAPGTRGQVPAAQDYPRLLGGSRS